MLTEYFPSTFRQMIQNQKRHNRDSNLLPSGLQSATLPLRHCSTYQSKVFFVVITLFILVSTVLTSVNIVLFYVSTVFTFVNTVLKFLNNLWGKEPSRNRVVVLAHQATKTGGISSLESILGLLKSLKFGLCVYCAIHRSIY